VFSTLYIALYDTLRLLAASAGLFIVATTPYAVTRRGMRWHQRARFVGLALLSGAIIGAYLLALGTVPEFWWRTWLVTAGIVLGMIGTVAYLWETHHAQTGSQPPRHGLR
jgi:peptidoglycan/LPS O-acetylase OafA/YrhL